MSIIQQIKDMQQAKPINSPMQVVQQPTQDEVEAKLRRKAGVLAAFGLADKAIADTLFISLEQVSAIKETVEFKESCAKQTYERTQRLIDLEEGIDAIETQSVARILQNLQYSNDPDYALRAFAVSNRAQRRSPAAMNKVIDASKVGNVINFSVSKTYVNQVTNNGEQVEAVIETQARTLREIPRKASDISSPKKLTEILQVDGPERKDKEIMKLAETVGISLDELDQMFNE